MAVRSHAVAQGTAAAGAATRAYTVPAATTLLLKSVELRAQGTTAWSVVVYIQSPAGSYVSPVDESNLAKPAFHWSGWIALNEGDIVQINASSLPANYWISGALLPTT